MQNEDSAQIIARFFSAIERLIADGVIRGKKTFTTRYEINRWNFITCSREQKNIKVAWLAYLVRDYNVNPDWLLLGEGEFYARRKRRKAAKPANYLQTRFKNNHKALTRKYI